MIVSAMQTLVAQILGDTSNNKWSNASHILPALNIAQHTFVHKSLAYSAGSDNVFDELTEIQATTTQSVDTTGYDLDGLASTPGPIIPGGYINSKATVDGVTKWVSRIPMKNLSQQNNRYLQGSDERPACYIYNNYYFLLVSTGSYPISTTIYYIREPKELVASGATGYQATTCELNVSHHRLICKMAAAECHRMAGDSTNLNKYQALTAECENELRLIATGNVAETKAKGVEAWRKNA